MDKHEIRGYAHSDETRRAIVSAAIRVVAEQGVSGASLRAINVAAGSRNSSAAHYHFGTKLAVLEAALSAIYAEVWRGQDVLFTALEERAGQGRPVGTREILEAGYLPLLALLARPEYGPHSAKFLSRILIESNDELQSVLNRLVSPMMHRCLALLKTALPQVPEHTLKLRIFITVTNVIHGAGDLPAVSNSPFGDLSGDNPLDMLHTLFDYMTSAVSAPPEPFTPQDEARMAMTLLGGN
jgi:AcrR family transcriptional regulator